MVLFLYVVLYSKYKETALKKKNMAFSCLLIINFILKNLFITNPSIFLHYAGFFIIMFFFSLYHNFYYSMAIEFRNCYVLTFYDFILFLTILS